MYLDGACSDNVSLFISLITEYMKYDILEQIQYQTKTRWITTDSLFGTLHISYVK